LRKLPEDEQMRHVQDAIQRAQIADRYRKRTTKSHAGFGHGTLSSALGPVQEPHFCDLAYLKAMHVVIAALLKRAVL
jgi:hypothetical protein